MTIVTRGGDASVERLTVVRNRAIRSILIAVALEEHRRPRRFQRESNWRVPPFEGFEVIRHDVAGVGIDRSESGRLEQLRFDAPVVNVRVLGALPADLIEHDGAEPWDLTRRAEEI